MTNVVLLLTIFLLLFLVVIDVMIQLDAQINDEKKIDFRRCSIMLTVVVILSVAYFGVRPFLDK